MKPDRNPLAPYQIHLAPVLGLCVSERVERGIRNHPEPGRIRISNYFCLGTYARVRLGGLTIWRVQCTTCRAVFTVLPHFVLRSRQMRPDMARDVLLSTHGGLSLYLCALLYHISPMV